MSQFLVDIFESFFAEDIETGVHRKSEFGFLLYADHFAALFELDDTIWDSVVLDGGDQCQNSSVFSVHLKDVVVFRLYDNIAVRHEKVAVGDVFHHLYAACGSVEILFPEIFYVILLRQMVEI